MKKQFYLLFFLLVISKISHSQTYHPLLENHKLWDVFYWLELSMNPKCNPFTFCGADRYIVDGDTSINNLNYKILKQKSFKSTPYALFLPPFELNEGIGICGFMREDTMTKKVFFTNGIDSEIVKYDFSLQVGDSFPTSGYPANAFLDSIRDYYLLNGETRKIFYFSFHNVPNNYGYYIEGIGGAQGLIDPIYLGFEGGTSLMCVKKESIALFGEGSYAGYPPCEMVTNNEIKYIDEIEQISYDELQNVINLHVRSQLDYNLKVIDLSGKVIIERQFRIINENYSIETKKKLNNGLYICLLISEKGVLSKKILVVNK